MMKRIVNVIGSTLIMIFTTMSGAEAVSLLTNGDFESGLTGWSASGNVGIWEDASHNHWAALGIGDWSGNSLLSQAFTIAPGYDQQELAFDYQFIFRDNTRYQVDIFASLVNGNEQTHLASFDTTAFERITGHHAALLIPQLGPGTYVLEFTLNEAAGSATDSLVKLDNIALTAQVPEPGTLLLLGSGLLGLAGFGRRRFNK